jgi:hypothetical protein
MKLILIHGRSQQGKDPVKLKQQWEEALNKGLNLTGLSLPSGLSISFPFYGDKLDELVQQVNAPLVTDVMMRGASPDSREAEFRGQLLYEMAHEFGITDAEIQRYYAEQPQERGPLNWEWVQSILKALDEKTSLGESAIDAFTRDVYVYLSYRAVRKAIDDIVLAELGSTPCVVVGHSLGSVVGYNILGKLSPSINVKRFITVGSPLGINTIKKKLDTPLSMPKCVKDWYNAMDERDVVALYPLDTNHFPINPAIENKTDVANFTDDRHGIEGYLSDPYVAQKIHEALVA